MSQNVQSAPAQVHHFKKPKSGNQDHSVHQTTPFQVFSVIALIILGPTIKNLIVDYYKKTPPGLRRGKG